MTMNEMLNVAIERIRQYLPEDHEMDDIACDDTAFQICIIDVSKFPGKLADRFFFTRRPGETEDETTQRFADTITEYTLTWRD